MPRETSEVALESWHSGCGLPKLDFKRATSLYTTHISCPSIMAALFRHSRTLCKCQRAFSTTAPKPVSLQWDRNDPEALAEVLPSYPYGPTRLFKQSSRGLYGGQRIQFGNNVSEKWETKTRRKWYPNVFTRRLYSEALSRYVQVRVSMRVLRTIDKLGGLDEYLLGEKEMRIKTLGESGWWLRWAIMQTPAVRKRFRDERARLGLPAEREQLESLIEAMTPAEEASIESETEAVAMDDAFEIQETENLKPIKFRVGKGNHLVLTSKGWRRTRPDYSRKYKEEIRSKYFQNYVANRMSAYQEALETRLTAENIVLDEKQRHYLAWQARNQFQQEMGIKLNKLVEQKQKADLNLKKARSTRRLLLKKPQLRNRIAAQRGRQSQKKATGA